MAKRERVCIDIGKGITVSYSNEGDLMKSRKEGERKEETHNKPDPLRTSPVPPAAGAAHKGRQWWWCRLSGRWWT